MTLARSMLLAMLVAGCAAGCGGGTQLLTDDDDDAVTDTAGETTADTPVEVPPDVPVDVSPDLVDSVTDTGPATCGPWPGGACSSGFVCDVRSCLDGARGSCVPDPGGACPEIYSPVCGCDGVTYANDCFRLSAGMALDHEGECGAARCGGLDGTVCEAGYVCDLRDCGLEAEGLCVTRPSDCPAVWNPVCGCDGVTYGNDCDRLSAGAAWFADGECGTTGSCGGVGDIRCPRGEVCDIRVCMFDAMGLCVAEPGPCPYLWDPVCGCDGVTYANDCARLEAGAALDYVGECGGSECLPACQRVGGGRTAWVDSCTGATYCNARCTDCLAVCRYVGSRSEGWYAVCSDVVAGCDAAIPDLITYADCG